MTRMIRFTLLLFACAILPLGTSGCATSVAQWIVHTRDHQGDVALAHKNYPDASVAYQLALKIDPKDTHARDGLVTVQLQLAQTMFTASKFEDAIDALAVAAKYAPNDDTVAALRNQIEQAEIKREIVLSNYPNYRVTGTSIQREYNRLRAQLQAVSVALRRFNYTYDTADLTAAIKQSYVLDDEVARLTKRLSQYRQLVESGVPESAAASQSLAPPASLLPLP